MVDKVTMYKTKNGTSFSTIEAANKSELVGDLQAELIKVCGGSITASYYSTYDYEKRQGYYHVAYSLVEADPEMARRILNTLILHAACAKVQSPEERT